MQIRPINLKAVLFHFESIRKQPEAEMIFQYLRAKNLKIGLFSDRRTQTIQPAEIIFKSFRLSDADVIVTAGQLPPQKSKTNAIARAAEKLKLDPGRILLVSSQPGDIETGSDTGTVTVFLDTLPDGKPQPQACDYTISRLETLQNVIRMGVPLPAGKLPNDLLREFLNEFQFDDPSLLIHPGVGEDIAAVDIADEQVLVLKSDPITFATDSIGQYAVLINANDIATSGAVPRWLLTTLLLPYGITPSEIKHIVDELKDICRQCNITLCGGHTEITDAVSRPVVTGMMAGTVERSDLIDKRNMNTGDKVLLTKSVAVEGTAIIAREFGDRLKNLGMSEKEIIKCRKFLSNISIIPEATIAAQYKQTSAMHDVTEGGLATALQELSTAGGHQIRIDLETIPVFAETRKICSLLEIDPLGLIGSGSLLICCSEKESPNLMVAVRKAGIEVACIGKVTKKGQGVEARKNKKQDAWPSFEVDEITKLF